eukprot:NODE_12146_length_1243_cov_3.171147.p1 GENE.NODE_12146_length_1243_cov_3.171147~~NODE_12146_length_1243_cov_3.171147.p1  ORF type:complete len:378 (-),score=74.22 NODE_12146_length_1243_cov_3.171147:108-1199(-)
MAGPAQPWYMPLTWPMGHTLSMYFRSRNELPPPSPEASAELDLIGHLTSFAGATRSFLMAMAAITWLNGKSGKYPGFGGGKKLDWEWMWPIIVRNLVGFTVIAGGWDFLLYEGFGFKSIKNKLSKYKVNPVYPPRRQLIHDFFASGLAVLTGSALEIMCCHFWSIGRFPRPEVDIMASPVKHAIAAMTITHWRIPHFYFIHRIMHPWRTKRVPDLGRLLYKFVHSQHHKSYNTTACAGTNMHPVESTAYFSAGLLAIPFGLHPAIILGCFIDCGVGAWLGHDGFQAPGCGDYFHQLHHINFDCNYGAVHVPIDKWFGTYCGKKEDMKKIWGRTPAGASANGYAGIDTSGREALSNKPPVLLNL